MNSSLATWAAVVMADEIEGMAWGENTSREDAIRAACLAYLYDYEGEAGRQVVRVYCAPVWIVRDDGMDEIVSFDSREDVTVCFDGMGDGWREVSP